MRTVAWYTFVILATLGLVLLLWQFSEALLLFLLSLTLAAAFRPLVNNLVERGIPPGRALVIIYALGLGLLVILLYAVSTMLINDLQQAANDFALSYEGIKADWPAGSPFQQAIAGRLPPPAELYAALAGGRGLVVVETVMGVTMGFFSLVGEIAIAAVLSIYWGADRARFERLWLSLLPADRRVQARDIWRAIEIEIGAYVRSELIQAILGALLLGIGYWGLGVKYPILLALVGAIAWVIPLVGGFLVTAAVLLAGWAAHPGLAGLAAFYTMSVFVILEFVVEPHFFDRRRFSSVFMVLMMIVLAYDYGFLGLIAAPPLVITIQVIFNQLVRKNVPAPAAKAPQLADLEERLAAVQELLANQPEPPSPEAMSMMTRLERLIQQAGETLPEPVAAGNGGAGGLGQLPVISATYRVE